MSTSNERPLAGQVAVVAGATRGAGRGIARMLGEAGATVYCTGRSVRGRPASGEHRPETIEETAELVTARRGGIPDLASVEREEALRRVRKTVRKELGAGGLAHYADAKEESFFERLLELGPEPVTICRR